MKFSKIPYASILLGPAAMVALGAILNQLAMGLNGAQMPVLVPGGCGGDAWELDGRHVCMMATTHLKILCDWINLHSAIWSIGDVLLWLGDKAFWPAAAVWVALAIQKCNEDRNVRGW